MRNKHTGCPKIFSPCFSGHNSPKWHQEQKYGDFLNPQETLLLMGTKFFHFGPFGVEKIGFNFGSPISKT